MSKRFRNNKGFSLVELIITVALIFVIVSLGYLIISAGNSNFDQGTAKAHLQQNTRLLDEYIQRNLRKATNMLVTSDAALQYDNTITVESNVAKANDESITASVIDDIKLRVDATGDRPIIEYIISASGDGEVYELINSMVMNNLPADYFSGNFSTFTSLGAAAISFNSDMILPLERSLSLEWDELVRGTVYSGEDTVTLNIYVENDIFNDAPGVLDASLSGGISDLYVVEILKVNATQLAITLGNGTVVDALTTGTITVHESAFQIGGDLTVTVNIVNPDIVYLVVSGDSEIIIPEDEEPVTRTYTMTAYDINDGPIYGEEATWSLVGTPQGVSIDVNSGILEVTQMAAAGVITIQAQSITNTDMTETYEITLLEDTSPSLQDIMDQILTLPYFITSRGYQYDSLDRPSYVTVPVYEGVTFEITTVSGFITADPPTEAVILRSQWDHNTGTITLTGTMDGESINKVFFVDIPSDKSNNPIVIEPLD